MESIVLFCQFFSLFPFLLLLDFFDLISFISVIINLFKINRVARLRIVCYRRLSLEFLLSRMKPATKHCFLEWQAASGWETYKVKRDSNGQLDPNLDRHLTPSTAMTATTATPDGHVDCKAVNTGAMYVATDWPTGIERCGAVR